MRIKTDPPSVDPRFMYISKQMAAGGQMLGDVLAIPFPSSGPFETARAVNSARNANNVVVGQMVGRSVDKQSMTWRVLPCKTWWRINRWIETNGMFFYCKYFSHNTGKWLIRRFYCGDPKCSPFKINPANGVPDVYLDCTLNVIDMGEDYSYTVSVRPI